MSLIARFWNALRQPIRHVGRDLEGNKYYEAPSPNGGRTKRSVQYDDPEDVWKYIGGGKRLPIQWSAWLTHTRQHPPSTDELQADLKRQQRVLENVAIITARDRAESEERLRLRQRNSTVAVEEAATRALGTSQSPAIEDPKWSMQQEEIRRSTLTQLHEEIQTKPSFSPQNSSSMFTSSERSAQPQSTEKDNPLKESPATDLKKSSPSTPFSSTVSSQTESWVPKARRRG